MQVESSSAPLPPARPRLTQRHPWLFPVAVRVHRAQRRTSWLKASLTRSVRWAGSRSQTPLPHLVMEHESPLLRELDPDVMHLQHSKITNLRLACHRVEALLIRPGETFSFNHVVGNCTRRRGFVDGMKLANGRADAGVGGGICQLANLLHWMFLHSPLTVVERSEHSFDPFPDKERVVPWGVGCSIVYNYVDLVLRNDSTTTFHLKVWVCDTHLHGRLLADAPLPLAYEVEAREEQFLRRGGQVFRRNEIWRRVIDRKTGLQVDDELVRRNHALVVYEPGDHVKVIDVE